MKSFLTKTTIGIALVFFGLFVIKPWYMQPNYDDGETAPNFVGKNVQGSEFSLEELRGKYVLVEFWGSWCGPCIKEIPGLKRIYSEFHGKKFKAASDFEIVSVAVESSARRWPKAIEKYGLHWSYHTLDLASNLKFFDSPIAKDYGVKEVPTSFLLNENGQIVGVNLKEEELRAFLQEKI